MSGLSPLPREALQRITREFAGERILWAGQPSTWRMLIKGLPILLFAIPWTAFALTWEGIALGAFFATGDAKATGAGGWLAWVFPLFGLPFVLIGFAMLGAPIYAAWRGRRMVHVLTDERMAEVTLGSAIEVKSFPLKRIAGFSRRERSDGTGDMTFLLGMTRDSDGDLSEKSQTWFGVPDVAGLEASLRGELGKAG